MSILFHCEKCQAPVDEDNVGCWENNICEECNDKWCQEQMALYRPQYDAEKLSSFRKNLEDLMQELRDAGRGHLIRR